MDKVQKPIHSVTHRRLNRLESPQNVVGYVHEVWCESMFKASSKKTTIGRNKVLYVYIDNIQSPFYRVLRTLCAVHYVVSAAQP
jgi:hypothetical protein